MPTKVVQDIAGVMSCHTSMAAKLPSDQDLSGWQTLSAKKKKICIEATRVAIELPWLLHAGYGLASILGGALEHTMKQQVGKDECDQDRHVE